MKYVVFAIVVALAILLLRAYMPPPPSPVSDGSSDTSGQKAFEMRIPNDAGTAWDKAWEESREAPLFIVVSADGTNCSVRGKTMPCSGVVGHIAQSLNLPKTTPIGMTAPPGQAAGLRSKLADDLRKSGYSLAAVIDVRPIEEPSGSIQESK
jgi:hypothetical protein